MKLKHSLLLQEVTNILNTFNLGNWDVGIDTYNSVDMLYLSHKTYKGYTSGWELNRLNVLNITDNDIPTIYKRLTKFLTKHGKKFKEVTPKPLYTFTYHDTMIWLVVNDNFKSGWGVRLADNKEHVDIPLLVEILSSDEFAVYQRLLVSNHRTWEAWKAKLIKLSNKTYNKSIS